VPSGEDAPRASRSRSTTRMEAFSDGVFSIAATLLVLDLAIHPPGTAGDVREVAGPSVKHLFEPWPQMAGSSSSACTRRPSRSSIAAGLSRTSRLS